MATPGTASCDDAMRCDAGTNGKDDLDAVGDQPRLFRNETSPAGIGPGRRLLGIPNLNP